MNIYDYIEYNSMQRLDLLNYEEMLSDLDLLSKQALMTIRFQLQNDLEELV